MSVVRLSLAFVAPLLAWSVSLAQAAPVRSELLGVVLPDSTTASRNFLYREAAKYALRQDATRLHRALGSRQEVFRMPLSAPAKDDFLSGLRGSGWTVTLDSSVATAAIVEKAGMPPVLLSFGIDRKQRWLYAADVAGALPLAGASPAGSGTALPVSSVATVPGSTAAPPSANLPRGQSAPPAAQPPAASPPSPASAPPAPAPGTGSFAFTTTTFDDGWTSKIGTDYVTITKGDVSIVQHYRRDEESTYMSVLEEQTRLFWNLLVAPRYRDVADLVVERNNPGGYEPINYAAATATEIATGRRVYIVLFNHPNRKTHWMEFVTPNQAVFEQNFGSYRGSETVWAPWVAMAYRNRFGVAPSDFVGTWSDNFSTGTSMVFAATGRSAGMLYAGGNTTVSFEGSTYRMDVSSGSGMVGSIRFRNVTYTGTFTVVDNWTIAFANNFEGRTRRFHASFEGIRDGRVLNLVLDEPGTNGITLHMIRVR